MNFNPFGQFKRLKVHGCLSLWLLGQPVGRIHPGRWLGTVYHVLTNSNTAFGNFRYTKANSVTDSLSSGSSSACVNVGSEGVKLLHIINVASRSDRTGK